MKALTTHVLLAAFALSTILTAQATAALPDGAEERVVALVEAAMQKQKIPGMTVAVHPAGVEDGDAVWSRGFGLADVENDVPATEKTVYRLASISKPMTAVLVMQLVEQGKIDLDAPIEKYVPAFAGKQWKPTVRQVLGHLGGVRHYKRGGRETLSNVHYRDVHAPLEIFVDDPLLHEPGTAYRYTTYGYNLLGAAASNVANRSFEKLLESRIFVPAGMRTIRVDDHFSIVPHRAQGYSLRRGELVNAAPVDVTNKVPGGGLMSTATDLVLFGTAMLDDELVKPKTREIMWSRMQLANGKWSDYGCGFGVSGAAVADGLPLYTGHGGSQPRVQTLLRIWPESGVVVSVMCNLQGAKLTALTDALGAACGAPGR